MLVGYSALARGLAAACCLAVVTPAVADQPVLPRRIDSQHLPNLLQVHDRIFSGGLPADDAAFAELRDRGFKTIISVDGAAPDAASAKRYGLRYVHLPHGYDGISTHRAQELAKGVAELAGPIYIHCHHGRHRSPAAAAVACVGAGLIAPTQAMEILSQAGTNPNYRGLYRAVQTIRPLTPMALRDLTVDFRESVPLPPLVESMVSLEQSHDRLKRMERVNWKPLTDRPDTRPPQEALILREHFTELLRLPAQREPNFLALLRESEQEALGLEASLAGEPPYGESPSKRLQEISRRCEACHRHFRDGN